MLIFGWHISISPILKHIKEAEDLIKHDKIQLGVQIFTKSPMQYIESKISDKEAAETKAYLKKQNIFLIVHGQYLINILAPPTEKVSNWQKNSIKKDLELIEKLCPDPSKSGVVIHLGKNVAKYGQTIETCFKNFIYYIKFILEHTPDLTGNIILETSVKSKNGADIFWDIEQLAKLYKELKKLPQSKRIKFCVDTCHIFASGYDIRTPTLITKFFKDWDRLIGIKHIVLIHFNDSKDVFQSQIDHHAEIGKGHIFKDATIKAILRFAETHKIPLVSESHGSMENEAKLVKKLV